MSELEATRQAASTIESFCVFLCPGTLRTLLVP